VHPPGHNAVALRVRIVWPGGHTIVKPRDAFIDTVPSCILHLLALPDFTGPYTSEEIL